jgi:hypothetical protein
MGEHMEKESGKANELEIVQDKSKSILLGGEQRKIKYGFSAWALIEERYGDVKGVFEEIKTKPFKNLPFFIFCGLVDKSNISESDVIEWLDDYGLTDLKSLLDIVQTSMVSALPQDNGKKKKDPRIAGTK